MLPYPLQAVYADAKFAGVGAAGDEGVDLEHYLKKPVGSPIKGEILIMPFLIVGYQ
jgi:hypothetical protein